MIPKITHIKPLPACKIWVKYEDGIEGSYDLGHLKGKGIFKIFEDSSEFSKVYIDNQTNAIAWNETIDICPDNVYLKLVGLTFDKWKEKIKAYA